MGADMWIVLQWWGTLFLVGAVAYPLTKALFGRSMTGPRPVNWWDGGYLFSKAVGMAVVTWIVFMMGIIHLMPFSFLSIMISLIVVFLLGLMANLANHESRITNQGEQKRKTIIHDSLFMIREKKYWKQGAMLFLEELFFLIVLFFWSWVKGHEPSIRGLEKFMDYGFMQSILNSSFFPPADMWYAGFPINYYYFGHMVTAVLTKLSGLDLAVTFNLMLATIFALTLTMSFSIGVQLLWIRGIGGIRVIGGGMLTAFLVTLAGNMQTIYAFTRGYTGENVKPFWELFWSIGDFWSRGAGSSFAGGFWGKIGEGMNTYWYPNATRFIPFTIHEFPSYSFVVSDVHGHVLSIPFVLLAIALLITLFVFFAPNQANHESAHLPARQGIRNHEWIRIGFYGFLIGILLMTNALDGPIYFGLFVLLALIHDSKFMIRGKRDWKQIALMMGGVFMVAGLASLPFLMHFKSFVTGVAVNCPLPFLANMKFGPILFESVEKCQRSALWMWWLLWGFFVYCGVPFIVKLGKLVQFDKMIVLFFTFALVLVIVPEFIYFKDIYPAHFRSNTMFKLGYEAFILFSIVAGYTIVQTLSRLLDHPGENAKCQMPNAKWGRLIFFLFLIPQLFLVSIYPIFSVRSYFNSLKKYEGIDGLGWLRREYSADYSAIELLNSQNAKCQMPNAKCDRYAIVEADGDSYTDYGRFSAFTGRPTIIGWAVHEWLWRGSYDVVAPRREEVRLIYESEDVAVTKALLAKYGVLYIIVGKLEREKYKSLQEWKFGELGREVFRSGGTVIYEVDQ